jgi:hypothetical protein
MKEQKKTEAPIEKMNASVAARLIIKDKKSNRTIVKTRG